MTRQDHLKAVQYLRDALRSGRLTKKAFNVAVEAVQNATNIETLSEEERKAFHTELKVAYQPDAPKLAPVVPITGGLRMVSKRVVEVPVEKPVARELARDPLVEESFRPTMWDEGTVEVDEPA